MTTIHGFKINYNGSEVIANLSTKAVGVQALADARKVLGTDPERTEHRLDAETVLFIKAGVVIARAGNVKQDGKYVGKAFLTKYQAPEEPTQEATPVVDFTLGTKVVFINITEDGDYRGMEDNVWEIRAKYGTRGKIHLTSLQNPEFTGFMSYCDNVRPATAHEVKIGRAVRAHEQTRATLVQSLTQLIAQLESGEVTSLAVVKEHLITLTERGS